MSGALTPPPSGAVDVSRRTIGTLQRRWNSYFAARPAVSFAVEVPGGRSHVIGRDAPAFTFSIRSNTGERAIASLDQLAIGMAYIDGHIDIQGQFSEALAMRQFFSDFHPVAFVARWAPAMLRGRHEHDRRSISKHYDQDSEFFLAFLDHEHHCYTHGVFERGDETLEDAMTRKLDLAIESLGVGTGDRVLEVGGGWGAFAAHAARRGIAVTALTLAVESENYLNEMFSRSGLPVNVIRKHLFEYFPKERYDAVVNMGVTEHLPNYRLSIRKYAELLKPGGKVYLDALAMRRKYRASTFMKTQVYPGNSAPLLLHSYLRHVARSPFELLSIVDDRHNYYLTCREWARRLDDASEEIVRRWGERSYRRFRLFLWGSATGFNSGVVQAYRWVLRLPAARS